MNVIRNKFYWRALACGAALAAIASICKPARAQQIDQSSLAGLKWRLVGPFRGGRAEAGAGVPGTNTYYFGGVAGGVWRSIDAGTTWTPIFDKEPVASIGAIAVAPSDPNVIYVGTGEPCLRGDISYGNGVYKSVDGGKSWTHVGLEDTRHIAKIRVDRQNPNIVFVAAIGHAYGPNTERGVFRSTDGGASWRKVLYRDDKTGAVDLVFDPNNSHLLYAALYQVVRMPWGFVSGGPGSGIYKSVDGGTTWTQLEGHGLPSGILGKIGIAVGADSDRVYALIEAEKGGLYSSDDAGEHWRLVTGDRRFLQRAWYYMHIFADPKNPDELYILNTGVYRSTDGGHTWDQLPEPHGDNHLLWIDPTNPRHLMVGDDGGVSVSLDWGRTWSSVMNQPTAEFYHVSTDNRFPYSLYGAQQDNTTVAIASRGNPNAFYPVGGGESGWIVADPGGEIVYADSYDGMMTQFDRKSGQMADVSAWPLNPMGHGAADLKYRFQWTAPIAASPFDPKTIYFGGNALFKTTDGGQQWAVISPDLTRNDKAKQESAGGPLTKDNTSVEYYDTIFCIAPSPVARGEIWVGSDDGLVHLTRDDGQHWQDVTPKDLPEWSKISIIDASHFDAGTAYVAVDRSKLDDQNPYLYKTGDYGESWTRINEGIPPGAFTHAIHEDPGRRGLLFAGTELGVYASFDGGAHWQALKMNLPTVPVHDLEVKGDDLVIATHGRAFWSLDDISPLRQLSAEIQNEPIHLFQPAAAYRARLASGGFGGAAPSEAIIDYWLKSAPAGEVTLEILDSKGAPVRRFSSLAARHAEPAPGPFGPGPQTLLTKHPGINRAGWDLRYTPDHGVPGAVYWQGSLAGPIVVPGVYQVKLTVGGQSHTAPLTVSEDPRVQVSQADLEKQLDLALEIQQSVNEAHDAINQMNGVRGQIEALERRVGSSHQDVSTSAAQLGDKITAVENKLINNNSKAHEDPLNFPIMLANQMVALQNSLERADRAPTAADQAVYGQIKGQIDEQLAEWRALESKDLRSLNEMIRRAKVPFVSVAPAPSGSM